jgi:hypothetical protein
LLFITLVFVLFRLFLWTALPKPADDPRNHTKRYEMPNEKRQLMSKELTSLEKSREALRLKGSWLDFHVQQRVRLAADYATQPQRFVKHLLQTSYYRILGFIRDSNRQLRLIAKVIIQSGELRATPSKNKAPIVNVPCDFRAR